MNMERHEPKTYSGGDNYEPLWHMLLTLS